jgi:outer membrane biogenesis lipoprotein LolB
MDTTYLVFYIIFGLLLAHFLTRFFGKFYKLRSEYGAMKEKARMELAQNPPAKRIEKEETEDYAHQNPEELIKELTPQPTMYLNHALYGQLGGGDPELVTRLEKKLKDTASQEDEQGNPRFVQYEKSLGILPGYLNLRGGDPELVTRLQDKLKEAAEDQDKQE